MQKLFIASDHAGFKLKEFLKEQLEGQVEFEDLGTHSEDSVDYPDYADAMAKAMSQGGMGVLICGSGIGISIAANRHKHIRAALIYDEETAKLSREHNDANVIALGARKLDENNALKLVEIFINISFDEGRHMGRVKKLGK